MKENTAGRPLRALILEDSVDDYELLLVRLRQSNFVLQQIRVDDEASLRHALKEKKWDVVISDYNMPQFSGLAALQIVREHSQGKLTEHLPFILLSGTIGEDKAVEAMRAGADDYVMKDQPGRLEPAIMRGLRDSEERRKKQEIESNLRLAEEELAQSQKLDALGRLSGGIAHDFNNILASILLNASALVYKLKAATFDANEPQEIIKAAERGAILAKQLLVFGRKEELNPADVEVNAIVEKSKEMLVRLIGRRINLQTQLSPEALWIKIDRSQLEQVIMNLVINSRDAIAEAGTVVIKTESVVTKGAKRIFLSVEDTGSGISPDIRQKVFDPFFTTKTKSGGSGLGLSIVYGVVKKYKGEIEIKSEPGKGTVVRLSFPASQAENFAAAEASTKSVIPVELQASVLLIEDESAVRNSIKACLDRLRCAVFNVEDAWGALELARKRSEKIDLLITDVRMPTMSGFELAEKIRAIDPKLRILFISGFPDAQGVGLPLDERTQFLAKPFHPDALVQKIVALCPELQNS